MSAPASDRETQAFPRKEPDDLTTPGLDGRNSIGIGPRLPARNDAANHPSVMTKSTVLQLLGRKKHFLDFELFDEAHAPGQHGGKAYDRAYVGYDFIGYSRARDAFLLVESWHIENDRLYTASADQTGTPRAPVELADHVA